MCRALLTHNSAPVCAERPVEDTSGHAVEPDLRIEQGHGIDVTGILHMDADGAAFGLHVHEQYRRRPTTAVPLGASAELDGS